MREEAGFCLMLMNPFQSQQFHVAITRHDFVRSLSAQQAGDDPGHVDYADLPFARMVDCWLLAVALGNSADAFTKTGGGGVGLRAVTALSVLNNDPGAIAFLMHVAVAHTDDPYVVQRPSEVVAIADGYAVAGVEELADLLSSSSGNRVMALSRSLNDRFGETA